MPDKRKIDEYDLVILGSGLGGLITAASLSKDYRNLLLLKERRYSASFVKEGYRFVPFSNFSERCLRRSLWQKISRILNLPLLNDQPAEKKASSTLRKSKRELTFQVILPEARIDLFGSTARLQNELKREFSKEIDQIQNFYKEIEQIGPLLRKIKGDGDSWSPFPTRFSPWIKRWLPFKSLPKEAIGKRLLPFSRAFQEFIRLQLICRGNLHSNRYPRYLTAYLLLQAEGEGWASPIDLAKMEKMILDLFVRSGGKVEEIEEVEKIEKRWWGGFVLSLKGEKKVVRSRSLLLNAPLHRLSLLFEKKGRKFLKWMEKIGPRYAFLPLFLGVDEEVIPVGMQDLLVSVEDLEKPYEGGNLLLLHLSPKGDESWAPAGKRAITVESLISLEGGIPDSLNGHMTRVMHHLEHLFPFLERYTEFSDWSWAKEQHSCWSFPHFLYETDDDFDWGKGVVPARLSRNIFFVGRENFPYLGLEGEILGGELVERQIRKRLRS